MFYKSLLKAFEAGELAINIDDADNSIVVTSLKGSALINLKAKFLTEKERFFLAESAKYFTNHAIQKRLCKELLRTSSRIATERLSEPGPI